MDPAGAEERPVGVELGEERLGVRTGAGAVAVAYLAAAQQDLDLAAARSCCGYDWLSIVLLQVYGRPGRPLLSQ
jgi:hypothetical protein